METEFIYFSDDYTKPMYSSKDVPLEYEDQTPCIKVMTETKEDMSILLKVLFPDYSLREGD